MKYLKFSNKPTNNESIEALYFPNYGATIEILRAIIENSEQTDFERI